MMDYNIKAHMIFDTKGQSKTTYLHTWVSPNPSTKMGIECCKKHIINGKFEISFTSFGKTQKKAHIMGKSEKQTKEYTWTITMYCH